MDDVPGLQPLLDAAEQAAGEDNWAGAEDRLRRAANLQMAHLGPQHPDLANTLNNLGVVCERAGKPDDAETFYRRAYVMASATLPADSAFVKTSRQNLRDLCDALGRPFDLIPEPGETKASNGAAVERAAAPAPPPPRVETARTSRARATTTAPARAQRRALIVGIVLGGLAVMGWWLLRGSQGDAPVQPPSVDAAQPADAGTPRETEHAPEPAAAPAQAAVATATASSPPPPDPAAPAPSRSASVVSIAEARLCRSLSSGSWRCTAAGDSVGTGPLFFYTRVRTPSATKVQHRWYHEDRPVQTVTLDIAANAGAGYRTYSRQTVGAERTGNWRVEIRDADGASLHEERFVVRN